MLSSLKDQGELKMNLETAAQTSQLGAKLQLGEVETEVEPKEGNSGQGRRLPTEPEEVSKEGSKKKLCSFPKADVAFNLCQRGSDRQL